MPVWAYPCRPCGGNATWFVSQAVADEFPPGLTTIRIKAVDQWICATLDRSRTVSVDGVLLRDAVPCDDHDCPECEGASAADVNLDDAGTSIPPGRSPRTVTAAAISLEGQPLVVVLVDRAIATSPGEAHMVVADLQPRFGGIPLVLMGQYDDGSPVYHGEAHCVTLLEGIPVERMPWKEYRLD